MRSIESRHVWGVEDGVDQNETFVSSPFANARNDHLYGVLRSFWMERGSVMIQSHSGGQYSVLYARYESYTRCVVEYQSSIEIARTENDSAFVVGMSGPA